MGHFPFEKSTCQCSMVNKPCKGEAVSELPQTFLYSNFLLLIGQTYINDAWSNMIKADGQCLQMLSF